MTMPDEIVNVLRDLRREVEAHLKWREDMGKKILPTTFGMYAVNNRHFVDRLRGGGEFQSSTIRRARKFMKDDRAEIERRMRGRK